MTTETSNAREWVSLLERAVPFLHDEAAKYDDDGSNEPLELAREIETLLASLPSDESALSPASLAFDGGREAAPPPAAARGDVRSVLQEMRDRHVARRFKSQTLIDWAGRIEAALAAEGVQCETCNGASVIVTYVDPYERGDVSSPEQSPCPDCAEGVQAGEVEQRARELFTAQADRLAAPWDRQWEPTKEHWRAKAREALSQQPEATLLREQPCGCVLCVCEDERQCHGCGARYCGNFTDHPAYVAQQPEARGVVGELVEVGDDESGQPRLLIHTTRDAIRAANLIPFSQVEVRNG